MKYLVFAATFLVATPAFAEQDTFREYIDCWLPSGVIETTVNSKDDYGDRSNFTEPGETWVRDGDLWRMGYTGMSCRITRIYESDPRYHQTRHLDRNGLQTWSGFRSEDAVQAEQSQPYGLELK